MLSYFITLYLMSKKRNTYSGPPPFATPAVAKPRFLQRILGNRIVRICGQLTVTCPRWFATPRFLQHFPRNMAVAKSGGTLYCNTVPNCDVLVE